MTITIKSVHIHAFRGIPDLDLELNGKNLLIQGDNGTGKSSVVEAIEYLFSGKVSNLEGIRGISIQRHGPHVKFKPKDVKVGMILNPGGVYLERTFQSSLISPQPFSNYLQVTQKGTFILRRSQILSFILSQPADRFRAIGNIIGIESLDEIELEMMRLRDDLKGEIDYKKDTIENLTYGLSEILGERIENAENILNAINRKLQDAKLPSLTSMEDINKHAEEMIKRVRGTESLDRIRNINNIFDTFQAVQLDKSLITDLSKIQNVIKPLLDDQIKRELSIAGLLKSGQVVLKKEKLKICPLCEQRINRELLLTRIDKRLRTLQNLTDDASRIRTLTVPIIKKLKLMAEELKSLVSSLELLDEMSDEKDGLIAQIEILNRLINELDSAKDLKNEIPLKDISGWKEDFDIFKKSLSNKGKEVLEDIGLTDQEKKVLENVRIIEQARSKSIDLSIAQSELDQIKNQYNVVEQIFNTFSDTKKKKIQEIYNSIESDIEKYYSILHPKEPHKNFKLQLDLGRRASTDLRIESFGREGEDPRAFTSEGHLDSLGLCIFLAFVRRFNEDCPLVVLDDIVTTVDSNHREKICKVLFDEFREKQFVITTHDGVWYEQLCASQRAYGISGKFSNLVFFDWDVDSGPRIRPYRPKWERIIDKLESGDKVGAGNQGRQYLEWVLEKICRITAASVQIDKWESGTVGDLFPYAKNRVKRLVKDEVYEKKSSQTFMELERTIILGNILSHNNPLAEELSLDEVRSFCNCVYELHQVIICTSCGHDFIYLPKLKIIRCSNPKCENPIEYRTK